MFEYADINGDPALIKVDNVNPYLIDAPDIVVSNRSTTLSDTFKMDYGSKPVDGGFLFFTSEERHSLLANNPDVKLWMKAALGAQEYLNGKERYCLWLADTSVKQRRDLMQISEVKQRIEGVQAMRLASNKAQTREIAETAWLFGEIRHPKSGTYILVPAVSSERRSYVPMGFFNSNTISTNANLMIPNAGLYEFGIITSQMHMDWMRTVAGRLESRYRYSAKLVYNNFPWPEISEQQHKKIEVLAQDILNERQSEVDKDESTTLADLYDPDLMPPNLRKAHKKMDKAVDMLYQSTGFKNALERVKHLFVLYETLNKTM